METRYLTDNRIHKSFYYENHENKSSELYTEESISDLFYLFDSVNIELVIDFYENGKIKSYYWLNENHKKIKTEVLYYENGRIKQVGYYKNNIEDSIWTYWYDNGQVYKIEEYNENYKRYEKPLIKLKTFEGSIDGEYYEKTVEYWYTPKNGNYLEYYKNGDIKIKGKYIDGNKDGIWEYYFEQEVLEKKEIWDKGVLIETIHY